MVCDPTFVCQCTQFLILYLAYVPLRHIMCIEFSAISHFIKNYLWITDPFHQDGYLIPYDM